MLVFGVGGQVGCHLIETASAIGRDLVGLTHEKTDVCNAGAVGEGFPWTQGVMKIARDDGSARRLLTVLSIRVSQFGLMSRV